MTSATAAVGADGAPPRDARFWRGYATAWLPLLTGYFGFILASNPGVRVARLLLLALTNVVPAALAGALPVAAAGWWELGDPRWQGTRGRLAFVARHAVAATAYSGAWYVGLRALVSLDWSYVRGTPTLAEFSYRETRWQLGSGLLVYCAVAAITMVLDQAARLRAVARRAERAEALRDRAELAAVRAQLNPHFLFNTLHSLLELVRSGDPGAEDAIERFAALSRYAFDPRADAGADVPLARELAAIEDYLAIERLRFGDRLRVCVQVDAAAPACLVPPLTLQPLVENAVRHAVAPRTRGATVRISAAVAEGVLRLSVCDDGPGAEAAAVLAAPGVGVRAVTQRVALRYGVPAAGVHVHTRPGEGFAVAIWLPARTAARP